MANRGRDRANVPRAGLIGCGLIGSALDERTPDVVLTHAGACQASPRVELAALCDCDPVRLRECGERRGVDARYDDFAQMLDRESLDLVCICTPVSLRLPAIEAAVAGGVKVILCEKPLAADLEEARAIARAMAGSGSTLALNFLRRWDPGIREAAARIRAGELGRLQRGVGFYGKGLLNNGSHLVDLLNMLLGPPARVRALEVDGGARDGVDPSFDLALDYRIGDEEAGVYLLSTDHEAYSIFELDLLGTRGRLRMTEKGRRLEQFDVQPDPLFAGYRNLAPARRLPTRLERLLQIVMEEMADLCLERTDAPQCGLAEGLLEMQIVTALLGSRCSGEPVDIGDDPA